MSHALRFAIVCLLSSVSVSAFASPCTDPAQAEKIAANFDADMAALTSKQKARETAVQGEITAIKKRMVETKRWTQKQSDNFILGPWQGKQADAMQMRMIDGMMKSAEAQQRYAQHMKQGEKVKACPHALTIRESVTVAGDYKEQQYQHMLATIKKATAK